MTDKVSKAPPVSADWTLIEADYRAGIKALRTIAEEHGLTHGSITKRAKRDSWSRDLTAKTRAKADELVSKDAVSTAVSSGDRIPEKAIIAANATRQYEVRIRQRGAIETARQRMESLSAELDLAPITRDQIEHLLSIQPDQMTARQKDDARQILTRLVSLSSRIASSSTLMQNLERVIKLENAAYGITDAPGEDTPAGAAEAAAAGVVRTLSDTERAVRLVRLLQMTPSVQLPGLGAIAPAGPAPVHFTVGASQ